MPQRLIGKEYPKALIRICEKCMQFNIEKRYANAMDLAESIRSWLDGAERKEKAMTILAQIQEIELEQVKLMDDSYTIWSQADEQMTKQGFEDDGTWALWNQSKNLQEQIEENRQEMHQLLQGALIYDPELTQTYQKLVTFEYEEYLNALMDADKKRQQKILRRMRIYIESLPREEAQHWTDREQKDHRATALLRKKHGGFIGRRLQIQKINGTLIDSNLLTLVGTAGVGKTHLVLEVSNQWRNQDGQESIFCDLTSATDLLGVEQALSKALSIVLSPNDPWKQICEALDIRGNTLLVLDNVEQIIVSAKTAVEQLLMLCSNLKIIITSRVKLGTEDESVFKLQPMSTLEGCELFLKRAQQAYPDFIITLDNRCVVAQIVNQLDRLPLAIELAAARSSTLRVDDILNRLSQRFTLLQGRMRDNQKQALMGALDWSWDLLTEEVQSAFAQCSVFRNGFDLLAAESIVDVSYFNNNHSIIDILEALYDDNLINKERQDDGRFRYTMLASIQEYTAYKFQELVDNQVYMAKAPERHARYYAQLFCITENNTILTNNLDIELDNLIVGVRKGQAEDAFQCCRTALTHVNAKGPILRGIEISDMFLSREDNTEQHLLSVKLSKSRFLRISGKMNEARIAVQKSEEQVLKLLNKRIESEKKKDVLNTTLQLLKLQAECLIEKGDISEAESIYEEAYTAYNEALEIYLQIEHIKVRVEAQIKLGKLYFRSEDPKTAEDVFKQALQLCETNNLFLQKLDITISLATLKESAAEYSTALELYKASLEIAKEFGDKSRELPILANIGVTYRNMGEYPKGISFLEQAIQLANEIGDKRKQGIYNGNIGNIYRYLGEYKQAIAYYEEAIHISEMIRDKRNLSDSLAALGIVQRNLGRTDKALLCHEQSLEIFKEIGHKLGEGIALGNIGQIYLSTEKSALGISLLKESVEILGVNEGCSFLGTLATACFKDEQYDDAIKYVKQSIQGSQEIGDIRNEGIQLGNLGQMCNLIGRIDEAEIHLLRSIEICSTILPPAAGSFSGTLALLYANQNKFEQSFELLRQGEPKVEVYPSEHCKFLCKKAQIFHMTNQTSEANDNFEQAKLIASEINANTHINCIELINKTEQFLSSPLAP